MAGYRGFMLGTGGSARLRASRWARATMQKLIAGLPVHNGAGRCSSRHQLVRSWDVAVSWPVAMMLGAEGEMLAMPARYGRVHAQPAPPYPRICSRVFVTAEKPHLLYSRWARGCTNMVLDAARHPALERGGCRHCHHAQPGAGAARLKFTNREQHQPHPPVQPSLCL